MMDALVTYVIRNMFNDQQFCGRSSVLQLLKVMDRWTEILDHGGCVDIVYCDFIKTFDSTSNRRLTQKVQYYRIGDTVAIFLDLSKAFDTIDHKLLFKKLEFNGIRGISLGYMVIILSERKRFVQFSNTISETKGLNCGVPQGSVLGPLLFLIYINDMPKSLKKMIALLFADDSTVYLSGSSLPELVNIVNSELHILCEWFKSNKLSLNVDKTNYMTIGKRGPDIAISIDGKLLSKASHFKFLGITVDQNLNWCEHMNPCKHKISSALFALGRARQHITEDSSKLLYYTLVYPYLYNGLHLWGGTFKIYLKSLIILQKRAVRIIANASRLAHTCRIFQRLHVLSLEQLHDYCLGKFMYSQIYKLAPALFLEEIIHNRDVHQYHTRNYIFANSGYP